VIATAFKDGRAYNHTVHDCTIHELRERVNSRFGKAPKVDLRITKSPPFHHDVMENRFVFGFSCFVAGMFFSVAMAAIWAALS
jgi:hypothetical protein